VVNKQFLALVPIVAILGVRRVIGLGLLFIARQPDSMVRDNYYTEGRAILTCTRVRDQNGPRSCAVIRSSLGRTDLVRSV